ncbi:MULTISPECIES: aspartate--ammonia ligase [Exiguobacterium]|uniref:Aspartate--ammonia ligase n=1 Tax=Exiguobacterium sibiricum (strain DSM 17290 / CCUG 55495 / CIP 109462 / JCM 13490 / 255-15) TaxID=262543 RepID=B1YJN3_EXIS2|nr:MULTISPECIES: aspartate--ammonia ligase [Exiguobacterium]ACB60063.1 Aspartate--ammonia ligase [Exiguobacterium sibiricum 255-15]MCT4791544.1 aspartate--ammonia ligase [Exiguobacterium artemiae]
MTTLVSMKQTQEAITLVKKRFEEQFSAQLGLTRVEAPLFVESTLGVNDHLNGTERVIRFDAIDHQAELEIVQSLAKWKRQALHTYGFAKGEGLYTLMHAIRRDEVLDETHSIHVDQWDWERVISKEERTIDYLQKTVQAIYASIRQVEREVEEQLAIEAILPETIHFMTTQELEDAYPTLSTKERETEVTKEYGAVFLMQIGGALASGEKHDGRAADYDDWTLNGDILVHHPEIGAFELSSMGIRVDRETLLAQIETTGEHAKLDFPFHQGVLAETLPLTIGGGIGQSRMAMFLLKKRHIGEVQASVWSEETRASYREQGVHLL